MSDFPKFQTIYLTKEKLSLKEKIDFNKYSGLNKACTIVSQRKRDEANRGIFVIAEWESSNHYEARGTFFEADHNALYWIL